MFEDFAMRQLTDVYGTENLHVNFLFSCKHFAIFFSVMPCVPKSLNIIPRVYKLSERTNLNPHMNYYQVKLSYFSSGNLLKVHLVSAWEVGMPP